MMNSSSAQSKAPPPLPSPTSLFLHPTISHPSPPNAVGGGLLPSAALPVFLSVPVQSLSTNTSIPVMEATPSPLAPLTPVKGCHTQDWQFKEAIELIDPGRTQGNMLNFGTSQPPELVEHRSSFSRPDATTQLALKLQNDELHAVKPSEQDKRGAESINLNRTPRQKPKRKKHRPKVIQESKPAKTPKPLTPKPITPKPARSTKRTYVRKNKKQSGSDAPIGIIIEDVEPHDASSPNKVISSQTNSNKSVRRSLNFDSEEHRESVLSNVVVAQLQEAFLQSTTSSGTKSTLQLSQGLEVVVDNTSAGIAFDLNQSLNQMLDDYIKLPEYPAGQTQLYRKERRRESLKDLARMKGSVNYHNAEEHAIPNGTSDVPLVEETSENDGVWSYDNKINIHGSYFPRIHKKRRTAKVCNEQAVDSPFASSDSKVFAFTHTQQLMAGEGTATENTCAFDRIEIMTKKRSKVPIRARNPSLLAASIACSSSTPENPCGCIDKQESQLHGPHACMEALFADSCVKMMTKKRTKKRQVHLLSSIYSNIEQQQGIVSRNYKYFLGKEPIVECQCSNNLQRIIHSSLLSGPVLLHVDPLEEILQKLKNLSIDRSQEDIAFHEEHAIIPYLGGGTMVPFEGPFDITKRRRPRAKVDLDPETCRVWKHLMGKGSLEADEELDMDKEKWWQDERGIFQGRVDSFIARMRLVQGDRRFSQWKGSVVDSVIGVFLTQNVSDHLSSSAFMALAARFPQQPRSKNGESSAETMGKSSEHNVECFPGFDDTIKGNEKNLHLEVSKQGSMVEHDVQAIKGFNIADSKELHASYTESGNEGCLKSKGVGFHGRELEIDQETRNNSTNTLGLEMDNTNFVDRPLADVFSSQSSTVSSENSSNYATETIIQVGSSSDSNSEAEDLILGKMCSGFNSPCMELPQNKETPKGLTSCRNHSQRYFTEDNLGANGRHAPMNCDLSSEVPVGPAGVLNLKPAGAGDLYASISSYSVQQLTSLQKEFSTRNNSLSRSNSMREVTETLWCSNILNSQVQGNLKDAPEVQTQTQQCTGGETCSSSCNGLRNEVPKADNSKLNDESYSSPNYPTETPSGAKKSKSKSQTTKIVDWETLRKQTCCYGAKKERSSERMDSLDWEAVRCADVNEVSKTIRERGMNNVLAGRIKDFLDRLVRDHGSIDLEWLRHVPPDKAKDYLLSIRGLGLKSVECVRLLTLHHLAFPVDTNVGRICVRLGWVPLRPLPESLQLHLLELYPVLETIQKYLWPRLCTLDQRTLYELHYHMITFGKVFCTKSKPNCNACPMRGECKHFASAFASARLALPGPEEKGLVTSSFPDASKNGHNVHLPQLDGVQQSQEKIVCHPVSVFKSMALPQLEGSELSKKGTPISNCEPIIEEPPTPPPESAETVEHEIEDAFYEDPEEIPTIELNLREFTQNLEKYIKENNVELQEGDWSKALVTLSPEAASIPMPKLKNVSRLRTEHQVYELPDSHPLLEGRDQREPDDPCPYLLAIWTPGETAQSTELPETCCDTRDTGKLCDEGGCFTCNSIREAHAQTVRGTLLIPCRTAMRGSFPLNGTYFQVNEVFADHDSSNNPIYVPRRWIWNLPRRTVFFGTSIPTIFRGLTTEGIQHCFWRGFVCVRGFERTTRAPRPLSSRLHLPASRAPSKTKRAAEEELVAPMKKRGRRARKHDSTQL